MSPILQRFFNFYVTRAPPLKFSDKKTMEGKAKERSMKGYGMVEPDSTKEIATGWSGRNPMGTSLSRH
jgi:hypothetical protein